MGQLLWETVWQSLKQLNTELQGDSTPRCATKGMETYIRTKTCLGMFTAALPESGNNQNVHRLRGGQTRCQMPIPWGIIQPEKGTKC